MDPRAAIVAIDYSSGDVLQLSGSCQILWDQHDLPGAERTLQFTTQAWNFAPGGIPVTTSGDPVGPSPYNPAAASWLYSGDAAKVLLHKPEVHVLEAPAPNSLKRRTARTA